MSSFRLFRATATLLTLASLAACSSKKDDPAAAPNTGMSWTVDGAAVSTTTLQSQKFTGSISVAGTVPAGATNPAYLSLEFPSAVGTYTFSPTTQASANYTSPGNAQMAYYAGNNSSANTVTGAGTIVVTALTATNVTGTFTFTGINANTGASESITNGKFNVGL
jgi:PKD repeat protein